MDHRVDEKCEKCERRATVYLYTNNMGDKYWICAGCLEDLSREED